ncbi:hypothetical protein HGRIS_003126 [Hohenbuehelia grisea]|uniref:Uncharacterized protein n=1 Tax=Hohenbuehelia grisea TaxID=104357 RepID=A0ABR3JPE1_9AGAR
MLAYARRRPGNIRLFSLRFNASQANFRLLSWVRPGALGAMKSPGLNRLLPNQSKAPEGT